MTPILPGERRRLRKALSASRDCATLEQLERLPDQDARVWDHVASCARCQAEWAILNTFESATPLPAEERDVEAITQQLARDLAGDRPLAKRAKPRWHRRFELRTAGAAGYAVAAVAVALTAFVLVTDRSAPELKAPSRAGSMALRSLDLPTEGPAGDLDIPPTELRWSAVPGASSYSVRVMEVDHADVWTSDTSANAAALPERVRSQVVEGKPLLWQVTAKDPKGFAIAQSAVQRFKLRERQPEEAR